MGVTELPRITLAEAKAKQPNNWMRPKIGKAKTLLRHGTRQPRGIFRMTTLEESRQRLRDRATSAFETFRAGDFARLRDRAQMGKPDPVLPKVAEEPIQRADSRESWPLPQLEGRMNHPRHAHARPPKEASSVQAGRSEPVDAPRLAKLVELATNAPSAGHATLARNKLLARARAQPEDVAFLMRTLLQFGNHKLALEVFNATTPRDKKAKKREPSDKQKTPDYYENAAQAALLAGKTGAAVAICHEMLRLALDPGSELLSKVLLVAGKAAGLDGAGEAQSSPGGDRLCAQDLVRLHKAWRDVHGACGGKDELAPEAHLVLLRSCGSDAPWEAAFDLLESLEQQRGVAADTQEQVPGWYRANEGRPPAKDPNVGLLAPALQPPQHKADDAAADYPSKSDARMPAQHARVVHSGSTSSVDMLQKKSKIGLHSAMDSVALRNVQTLSAATKPRGASGAGGKPKTSASSGNGSYLNASRSQHPPRFASRPDSFKLQREGAPRRPNGEEEDEDAVHALPQLTHNDRRKMGRQNSTQLAAASRGSVSTAPCVQDLERDRPEKRPKRLIRQQTGALGDTPALSTPGADGRARCSPFSRSSPDSASPSPSPDPEGERPEPTPSIKLPSPTGLENVHRDERPSLAQPRGSFLDLRIKSKGLGRASGVHLGADAAFRPGRVRRTPREQPKVPQEVYEAVFEACQRSACQDSAKAAEELFCSMGKLGRPFPSGQCYLIMLDIFESQGKLDLALATARAVKERGLPPRKRVNQLGANIIAGSLLGSVAVPQRSLLLTDANPSQRKCPAPDDSDSDEDAKEVLHGHERKLTRPRSPKRHDMHYDCKRPKVPKSLRGAALQRTLLPPIGGKDGEIAQRRPHED